jgi:diacylglycerol kinase (ATP)
LSLSYAKVIVNPAAGAGRTGRIWPQIMGLFEGNGLRFEHELTEAPGHAIELAKSAIKKGFEMVVSVGGDGTINEVVNGLYRAGNIRGAMLGIISTGTGSDYIRTIGLPRQYENACRCLVQPRRQTVDLGIVEYTENGQRAERIFVNFAGMGFDAEIVRRTTQKYKVTGSTLSYLLATLTTFMSYSNRDISLTIDGETVDKRVCTVLINNGKYGGGGMFAAPDASVEDGFFDVLIIDDISKPDLLRSLPRIYKGTHLTHPKVTMVRAKEVEVKSSDGRMQLQADGELLGEVPSRFRVLPAALNIVV